MTDATGYPGGEEGPVTEEQAREYLAQLRSAPVAQVLTELLSGLLSTAQAKLGRRDARLLIDIAGTVTDHARRHLPADLTMQVDQALSQLRLHQVEAEGSADGAPEPNDLPETPTPPAATGEQAAPGEPAATAPPRSRPTGPAPASQLWIPGRDF